MRSHPKEEGRNCFCSLEHQRLGQRRVVTAPFSKSGPYDKSHDCVECEETFYPHHPSVRYCSTICKSRAKNNRTLKRWEERGVVPDDLGPRDRRIWKATKLKTQKTCAICEKDFSNFELKQIHVDHDHNSGKIRDLLCSSCNQGLGNFKDDQGILEKALKYLQKWEDK